MAKKMYEEANIREVAKKIRAKTGGVTTYTTKQMPDGIDAVYTKGYNDAIGVTTDIVFADGFAKIDQNGRRVLMPYKQGDFTDAWYYGDERSTDITNLKNVHFIGPGSENGLPTSTPNKYGYMGQNMMAYSPYGISVMQENGENVYWFNQAYRTWGRQLRLEANCSYTLKLSIKSPTATKLSRFCVLNRAEAGALQYNKNANGAFEAIVSNEIVSPLVDKNVRVGGSNPLGGTADWEEHTFDFTTVEGKPYVDIVFEQMLGGADYYLKDIQIICQKDMYYSTVTVDTEVVGGGTDPQLTQIIEGTLTEFVDDSATHIAENMCLFMEDTTLEKMSFLKVKSVGDYAMGYAYAVTELNLPEVETIGNNCFYGMSALSFLDLPKATYVGSNSFSYCDSLKTIVLRSNVLCAIGDTDTFVNISNQLAIKGVTVYVPQALIESYQTATNWSTLYTKGEVTFVAIEGSEYE